MGKRRSHRLHTQEITSHVRWCSHFFIAASVAAGVSFEHARLGSLLAKAAIVCSAASAHDCGCARDPLLRAGYPLRIYLLATTPGREPARRSSRRHHLVLLRLEVYVQHQLDVFRCLTRCEVPFQHPLAEILGELASVFDERLVGHGPLRHPYRPRLEPAQRDLDRRREELRSVLLVPAHLAHDRASG